MRPHWWNGEPWRRGRLMIAGAVVVVIAAATTGGVWLSHRSAQDAARAGALSRASIANPARSTAAPTPEPTLASTSTPSPSPAATPSARPATPAAAPAGASGGPAHFATLAPGAPLPAGAQCAAWVRTQPFAENKRVNSGFNQKTGHPLGGSFFPASDDARTNAQIGARVDGAFTGSTHEILRWAACKWGIDEDIVYAQAAKESWWRQTVKGDFGGDPTACAPGHGLGVDGQAGQCPQSYGVLQNRYPYEQTSWPGIDSSTAMNADTAYAIWRACFEGYEHWLNDVDRGSRYGAGDAWGCVGRWFAGRWHTGPADQYMAAVQDYQRQRIWEQGSFQEA